MDVEQHVRFFTKDTPAFGEREFWECRICKATGGDEPALGRTARQMAAKHFEKVRQHFHTVAFLPPPDGRRDDLYKWMKEELAIYGGNTASATIASMIAHEFYRSELRERDEQIERLTKERDELRRAQAVG